MDHPSQLVLVVTLVVSRVRPLRLPVGYGLTPSLQEHLEYLSPETTLVT